MANGADKKAADQAAAQQAAAEATLVKKAAEERKAAEDKLEKDRIVAGKKWAAQHGANAKRELLKGYKQLADFDAAYKSLQVAPGPRAKEGLDWTFKDAYEEVSAQILATQDIDDLRASESAVFREAIPKLVDGYLHVLIGRAEWIYAGNRLGRWDWGIVLFSGRGKSNFEDVDAAYQRVKAYLIGTANTGTLGPMPVLQAVNPFYTNESHRILNDAKEQWTEFMQSYESGGDVDMGPLVMTLAYLLIGSVAITHAKVSKEQVQEIKDLEEGQDQPWATDVYNLQNIEYNIQLLRNYLIGVLNTAEFGPPPDPLPDASHGTGIGTFYTNPSRHRRAHKRARLEALKRDMLRTMKD